MNKLIALFVLLILNSHAFAGGFEKVTMWSAKWSSLAAAATAGVEGSESLLFNPAGLVAGDNSDVSLNLSPGVSKFKGPAVEDDQTVDGENVVSPVMGVTSKYRLSDKLALGLGVYVAGGTTSEFKDLDFSSVNSEYDTLRPSQKSSLSVIETGLGAAYKLSKNWSIGATWRITMVNAELSSAKAVSIAGPTDVALINVHLKDLKDENFASFRLGTQFIADSKNWGIGLAYRSAIDFEADGTSSGELQKESTLYGSNGTGNLEGGGDVTVASQFPQQISLGAFSKLSQKTTLFYEVTWTEYSKLKKLEISGEDLNLPAPVNSNVIQDIDQNWEDQWNLKLALQYQMTNWTLRGGYALTTKVTPDDYARVTFSSPGLGHTFVAGAGRAWMNGKLITDFAAEYSMAKGNGVSSDGISGEYSTGIMVAHMSCKYLF